MAIHKNTFLFAKEVYKVVAQIPAGKIFTYGISDIRRIPGLQAFVKPESVYSPCPCLSICTAYEKCCD